MQNAQKNPATDLNGQGLKIAIVQARFNSDVTDALLNACVAELRQLGVSDIFHVSVPGALEVPFALQKIARKKNHKNRPDALIALGCIIRGETYHFELVANESGAGITRVSLDENIPIANAILTVENMAQATARQNEKGAEAARVAVEMARLKFQKI